MAVMGYKLTYDTGFAPNPFHGVLTLATCKPKIRLHRARGDWIAGFASSALVDRSRRAGVHVTLHGLIYLAQITEGPIELGDYYDSPEFFNKRPDGRTPIGRAGDNIYQRVGQNLVQRQNFNHGDGDVCRDQSGRNVLICRRFYYFGRNAFLPPSGWAGFLDKAPGRTFHAPADFADLLLREFDFIGVSEGIHGTPCGWNEHTDRPFIQKQASSRESPNSSANGFDVCTYGSGVSRSAGAPAKEGCGTGSGLVAKQPPA